MVGQYINVHFTPSSLSLFSHSRYLKKYTTLHCYVKNLPQYAYLDVSFHMMSQSSLENTTFYDFSLPARTGKNGYICCIGTDSLFPQVVVAFERGWHINASLPVTRRFPSDKSVNARVYRRQLHSHDSIVPIVSLVSGLLLIPYLLSSISTNSGQMFGLFNFNHIYLIFLSNMIVSQGNKISCVSQQFFFPGEKGERKREGRGGKLEKIRKNWNFFSVNKI